jgi:L-lysine 2,3-aminomutase
MRCAAPASPPYRPIVPGNVARTRYWRRLNADTREAIEVVSLVLPFRTNEYVLGRLVDWGRAPDDPLFRLTFPHRDMLSSRDYARLQGARRRGDPAALARVVGEVREGLNPHSQGQSTCNVPELDGRPLAGVQHKYHETVLFFPSAGQSCHAFCTYCFRWSQFVDEPDLRFAGPDASELVAYLHRHPEVTDVLVTGGDPLTMSARRLRDYVDPLLAPELESLVNLRIGTKAPASWPHRFLTDDDADDLLRLFDAVVCSGRHLAIMVHYVHPRELSTPEAEAAIARIRATGAEVRTQAPLVRHINDDPRVWVELWRKAVRLGVVPYYMFVARDTGASAYFEMPLVRAYQIFRDAYARVSGLARTVRGPVMSALPGKVRVVGFQNVDGRRAFVLDFLQAREPSLVRRPFFARYDPEACWFDELRPLEGEHFAFV